MWLIVESLFVITDMRRMLKAELEGLLKSFLSVFLPLNE